MTRYQQGDKFRVLADGINFVGPDGSDVRAEKGDVITGMAPASAAREVRDGKIGPVGVHPYVVEDTVEEVAVEKGGDE